MPARLVILEGFWRLGKTELAKQISTSLGCQRICEPNHLHAVNVGDVQEWYKMQHLRRHKVAATIIGRGHNAVMDRSILSWIAYQFGREASVVPEASGLVSTVMETSCEIYFIDAEQSLLDMRLEQITDDSTRKLLRDEGFCERYRSFYQAVLPDLFGLTVVPLRATEGKQRLVDKIVRNTICG